MGGRNWTLIRGAGLALIGLLSVAAAGPRALAPASGGLWQIAFSARGGPKQSLCVADPLLLGQWEHRGGRCSRVIVSDEGNKTVINYD